MQIMVQFTEEYRQQQFIEEGILPEKQKTIEVDPTTLEKATRQLLAENNLHNKNNLDFTTLDRGYNPTTFELPTAKLNPDQIISLFIHRKQELREMIRAEEEAKQHKADAQLTESIARHRRRLEEGSPHFDSGRRWMTIPDLASKGLKEEAEALNKDITEALEERRKENEQKQQEEVEQYKRDKARWITENGSEHLKEATAEGYNCQRRYITERASLEFPEYNLDFDEQAEYRDRSCPSSKALAEAKRVSGRVVWLTAPWYKISDDPYDDFDYDPEGFEPTEAVVIDDYLEHKTKRDIYPTYYPKKSYTLIRAL